MVRNQWTVIEEVNLFKRSLATVRFKKSEC